MSRLVIVSNRVSPASGGSANQGGLAVALTASGAVRDVRRAHGPVHGAHVIPGPVD